MMDVGQGSRQDWALAGEAELADIVELRRAIHADPEIGLHCPRTTQKIRAALAGLPLEYRESSSTTGFVAILRGGARRRGRLAPDARADDGRGRFLLCAARDSRRDGVHRRRAG